jgi:hypothetical protein
MITATQIISRKETLNDYHKDHTEHEKIFSFKRYGTQLIIFKEVKQ